MGRLLRVTRILGDARPLADRLRDALDEVIPAVRAARAFWVLVDANGNILLMLGRDHRGGRVEDPESLISSELFKRCIAEGQAILRPAEVSPGGEVVLQPCLRGGEVLGILGAQGFPQGPAFTEYDRGLLEILADQGAAALQEARALRESSREARMLATGNLAAGVTHDFNNILATIIGRAQDLLRQGVEGPTGDSLLAIERAARQGAEVVRRIEELTRRRSSTDEQRALARIVDDVVEFTRFRWEGRALSHGHRMTVRVEVPEDLHVNGFAPELSEVFTSLMLAGIDALPEGGEIAIRAAREGPLVDLVLDARGARAGAQERKRLLDPYGALEGPDTGMGISAACRVLKGLGGRLDLDEAPGQGLRFRLLLPVREAPPAEAQEGAERPATPAATGKRILVVDDEEGVRELLSDLLELAGFDVRTAADGPEALRLFTEEPADLVLTDLGMEPWSGWDVASRVRAERPETAIILITGWAGEVPPEVAAEKGIDQLLTKPFDIEEVLATVSEVLLQYSPRK